MLRIGYWISVGRRGVVAVVISCLASGYGALAGPAEPPGEGWPGRESQQGRATYTKQDTNKDTEERSELSPPIGDEPEFEPEPPPTLPEAPPSRRSPAPDDEVVVVMRSGERYEGRFVSGDALEASVRIGGIVVRFERASIERLIVLDPPEVRYREMRRLIGDKDTDRLVMLADWLQRQRMFDESLAELDHVLSVESTHPEALRLRQVVARLAELAARSRPGLPGEERPAERERPASFPARPKAGEFPLLTPDQVNLIKVYEADLNDPPRIVIPRRTIERLMAQYSEDPLIPETREGREALARRPAHEILDLMFRLRAREFYGQVQVLDHPRSMRLFRDNVHAAWLINSCGTTRCHGGSEAGRLQLYNYRPTAEQSVYTNFLIIDRFRTRDGRPLIDYEKPEQSILLQMGLPRNDARVAHPPVQGWSPVFRSRDNRRFRQAVEWIRSMYRPRPEHPIEYIPPGEASGADGEGPASAGSER